MANTQNLEGQILAEVWSPQVKELFEDSLMAQNFVNYISEDFGGQTTWKIRSLGDISTQDRGAKGSEIPVTPLNVGEFDFKIDRHRSAGFEITDEDKEDKIFMEQTIQQAVPKLVRGIMEDIEEDILRLHRKQTKSDYNVINGLRSRFIATDTNHKGSLSDLTRIRAFFTKNKINVPIIGVVDTGLSVAIEDLFGTTSAIQYNPEMVGVLGKGLTENLKYKYTVHGINMFESLRVDEADADETLGGVSASGFKTNLFFPAAKEYSPFIGKILKAPSVRYQREERKEKDVYFTTSRFGHDLYRPEALVTYLTDGTIAY